MHQVYQHSCVIGHQFADVLIVLFRNYQNVHGLLWRYVSEGNAVLNNWTMDAERGYFLAPMEKGIRLTTGAEFANRDAPKSPVQLARAEKVAREIFPLADRLDAEPWMGARPCTPDMMPVIGE